MSGDGRAVDAQAGPAAGAARAEAPPAERERAAVQRFSDLTFDGFRALARDDSLSPYEKIGFPDSYRAEHEGQIFDDIVAKLPALSTPRRTVVDIGPGCSTLPRRIIDLAERQEHTLLLVDSAEMLAALPDAAGICKVAGFYPRETSEALEPYLGRVDVVLCYSVLHYLYVETNLFDVLDRTLALLAPGGRCLFGDVPNVSMRKRFFSSDAGVAHHRAYTGTTELPRVVWPELETGRIDDAVILGLVARARAAGFDAYVLPQSPALPMANRREDLLFVRP